MEIAVKTLSLSLNPKPSVLCHLPSVKKQENFGIKAKSELLRLAFASIAINAVVEFDSHIISYKQVEDVFIPNLSCNRACFPPQKRYRALKYQGRERHVCLLTVHAVSSDVEDVGVSSQFEDFTVTTASTNENRELKISVEISGAKTRAIFDDVFDKMVAAAQPIPGFRRVKGGKTPNIPRDILLEVLGASKVYKQVITKVINSTVAEYVERESLAVGKDLRVEQSFEDLEEMFEPDEKFRFDAVIKLQETN